MRFNTGFLRLVQEHGYKRGGEAGRIFEALIDHRIANRLDERFECPDPLALSDEELHREIEKLAIVFEAVRSRKSDAEKRYIIELLKEQYSPAEVEEIVEEYFPQLCVSRSRIAAAENVVARP